jgi:lipocalin
VDLKAIQGSWYIVANIPNHFEKGMVAPFDVYTQRANGDIQENFTVRFGGFDANSRHLTITDSVVAGSNNASWRVHIFGLVSLPLLLLYTDPGYRYVLFGENDQLAGLGVLTHFND